MKIAAAAAVIALVSSIACAAETDAQGAAVDTLREEIAISGILERLGSAPFPEVIVIRNVRIVDPVDRTVKDGQSIIASLGVIYWIGDAASEPDSGDATIVEGGGKFAAPGLTDMHIHTESASDWLLNIANGVTTVREMGGFPWMLAARERVGADRLLAPSMYVAGTIINFVPLEGYAVTPKDVFSARRVVRQQRACGNDFIKVHNFVPQRIFDAVADEAKRENMDLVGHAPRRIEVRYAADRGMRTIEHLKGWLNDGTLKLGDTDYAAAKRADLWVTPTFYAYRNFDTAERMKEMAAAPEARFVPARKRKAWAETAAVAEDADAAAREAGPIRRAIVKALVAEQAQFLAGTDAANYPFQVMGFALIDEMQLLEDAGVPKDEVLKAATVSPAAAMRAGDDFGRIARGMRADVVLLEQNPLDNVAAYEKNEGVIVRGRWLERAKLDAALDELAGVYADGVKTPRPKKGWAEALADKADRAVRGGFVFNARILREAADALRAAGEKSAAARIEDLAITPTSGPCAAEVR